MVSRKNEMFQKGLVQGFGPNLAIFSCFFLGNLDQENLFYDILEQKNAILDYNTRSLKSLKIEIFPKGLVYGLGPKLVIFHVSFFGKLEQESVLYDILGRKSDILGYKSKKLKSLNIEIFPNGLVHCFGPKLAIFSCFFFRNLDQVTAFYDILERKNAILTYKTRSLKSQKMG